MIQDAFSKRSLVSLISKDVNLVFNLSVLQAGLLYDVIIDFHVDLMSLHCLAQARYYIT